MESINRFSFLAMWEAYVQQLLVVQQLKDSFLDLHHAGLTCNQTLQHQHMPFPVCTTTTRSRSQSKKYLLFFSKSSLCCNDGASTCSRCYKSEGVDNLI